MPSEGQVLCTGWSGLGVAELPTRLGVTGRDWEEAPASRAKLVPIKALSCPQELEATLDLRPCSGPPAWLSSQGRPLEAKPCRGGGGLREGRAGESLCWGQLQIDRPVRAEGLLQPLGQG